MEPDRKTSKFTKFESARLRRPRSLGLSRLRAALRLFEPRAPTTALADPNIGRGTAPGPMTLCRSGGSFPQANSSAEPTARSPATRPAMCM